MRVEIRLLDNGLGILYTIVGQAGQAAWAQAIVRRHIRSARYVIVDFTDADLSELGDSDVKGIVQGDRELASLNQDLVQAIVAPGDLSYGIGRMYASRIDGGAWPTQVFRVRDEAEAWLRTQLDEALTFTAGPQLVERSP